MAAGGAAPVRAAVRPRPQAEPVPAARPRLRQARRRKRPLAPIMLLVLLLLSAGLVAPVAINMASLKTQAALNELEAREQELVAEIAELQSVAAGMVAAPRVKEQAEKLGLYPATSVHFINIEGLSASAPSETEAVAASVSDGANDSARVAATSTVTSPLTAGHDSGSGQ